MVILPLPFYMHWIYYVFDHDLSLYCLACCCYMMLLVARMLWVDWEVRIARRSTIRPDSCFLWASSHHIATIELAASNLDGMLVQFTTSVAPVFNATIFVIGTAALIRWWPSKQHRVWVEKEVSQLAQHQLSYIILRYWRNVNMIWGDFSEGNYLGRDHL